MRASLSCVAALVACAAFGGGHDAARTWFTEDHSGHAAASSVSWTTDAGTWTKENTSDRSVYSAADGQVLLDTRDAEIAFRPRAGASATNALVTVTCRMAFTVCLDLADWSSPTEKDQQAAIGIREREDGRGLTFFGWRSRWFHNEGLDRGALSNGAWIDLSAPGVEPVPDVVYTVTIENDQSCVPSRIRYSINGHPLADASGETWLTAKSSLKPWDTGTKRVQKVCFRGLGRVGDIVATEADARAARADVALTRLERAVEGSEIAFSVTNRPGQTLGGALTCRWYREDATGLREPECLAENSPSYAITSADYGHWITVDVSDEHGYAGTGRFWCSDLPVAYIDVEPDATGSVWPRQKGVEFGATMLLTGNGEYAKQYDGAVTIKVRGNSTAGQDKKPYKLKLDKKADLFGLGGGVKNKHWVLLANAFDESLMRNRIAFDLSARFDILAMKSEWVDVVMNDEYVGNYQLCQHIRVGEERVGVYDWSDAAEKIAEKALEANAALSKDDQKAIEDVLERDCGWMSSGRFVYLGTNYVVRTKGEAGVGADGVVTVVWKKFTNDVSGGYIYELDAKKMPGAESPAASAFTQTNANDNGSLIFDLAMNTPEYAFTNGDVRDRVWNDWREIGLAWLSETGMSPGGVHYRELCDFDSMVGYWLTMYVLGNDDAGSYSRYAYQDQGGRVVFAPAWDFDCGMGSLSVRVRSAAETNDFGRVRYAAIQPEKWIPANGSRNFMGHWTRDPYFSWKLREKYREVRPYMADLVRDGGILDGYCRKLAASAKANDLRWNNRIGFFGDGFEHGDASVLKEFLTRRFAWLDGQFATVAGAVTNLTRTVNASKLRYTRDARLQIAFAGAVPRAGADETDVADVGFVGSEVRTTVTVPSGTAATVVVVSVNGFSNTTWTVNAGVATGTLLRRDLRDAERNFIGFDALDASGKIVARNVALLTAKWQNSVLFIR